MKETIKKPNVHPVDPISVACKSNPIPLKDLDDKWLTKRSDGWYGGHPIHETLLKQEFKTMINGEQQMVCRWAAMFIDENLRNAHNLIKAEERAQSDMKHSSAHIVAKYSIQPCTLSYRKDGKQRPIIGVRVFHGGPQQAINEYVYYIHHGFMRCNIAQDSHLQEGVYAWNDIVPALKGIELNKAADRTKCIGIIEGYLSRRHEDKLSLNPRSTKLLAIFAPWDEEIHMPFELGVEDTLAFRLPPISWEDQ